MEKEKASVKYRVGVVAETPHGVLLTQEIQDTAREAVIRAIEEKRMAALTNSNKALANRYKVGQSIVEGGRFSLPGGGPNIIDFEVAGETKLVDEIGIQIIKKPDGESSLLFPDMDRLPTEVVGRIMQIMKKTAVREVQEELGITPPESSLKGILQINGNTRRHLIYIVALDGEVNITDPYISGIGFIDRKHVIPLSKFFFQGHIHTLYSQYICDPNREIVAKGYASRLTVPIDLIEGWFTDEIAAYHYLSGKGRKRTVFPRLLESSPTFRILGKDGKIQDLRSDSGNFTVSKAARLIPRSNLEIVPPSDRGPNSPVKVRRSPSNPTMPKVNPDKKQA